MLSRQSALAASIVFVAVLGFNQTAEAQEGLLEVMLADPLDEPRGYCLDIAGGRGVDAPLDQGLQAHTCYNYTGRILEDQGFDASEIEEGQFRLPYFDVCAAAEGIEEGAALVLESCDNMDAQSFELNDAGNLVISSRPDLCVTVSSSEKREGRGGSPIHVMRPLTLQPCTDDDAAYQTWTLHSVE